MMGEEKEIKRTLSCQDFVTLHILVQVMCFFGRRCLPRSDSWFSISKNLFFSSRLVENDEKVYSVTFLMTLIIVQRRRENTEYGCSLCLCTMVK